MSLFFATYLILFLKQPSHSFYKSLKFYFFTEPKNHTLSWVLYGKAFLCFENVAKARKKHQLQFILTLLGHHAAFLVAQHEHHTRSPFHYYWPKNFVERYYGLLGRYPDWVVRFLYFWKFGHHFGGSVFSKNQPDCRFFVNLGNLCGRFSRAAFWRFGVW